jgi:hypothetical protein
LLVRRKKTWRKYWRSSAEKEERPGGFIYKKESQFPEIDIGDMIRDLVWWYHSYIRLVGNRVLSMDRRILERKLTRRVEWSGVWGLGSEILGKPCGKPCLFVWTLDQLDQGRVQAERTANLGPNLGKGISW